MEGAPLPLHHNIINICEIYSLLTEACFELARFTNFKVLFPA